MSDPYVIYGGGVARDVVVRMVLEEAGVPYDVIFVDGVTGAHRTKEFLEMNPAGYIPAVLTPEKEMLFETAAIMLYVAERHELHDLLPMPGDKDRGQFLAHLFYHTNEIQPSTKRWFYPHRFSTESAAGRDKIMDAAYQILLDRWGVLDQMLAENGPYHLGDRFSILDMHMAMWATYGLRTCDEIIETFPAVARVTEDVRARPASGHILNQQREDMLRWRDRTEHMTTKTGTY
ncbi:MAG: glutathione S-transferase family protein [Pseudomonadota bacterium]